MYRLGTCTGKVDLDKATIHEVYRSRNQSFALQTSNRFCSCCRAYFERRGNLTYKPLIATTQKGKHLQLTRCDTRRLLTDRYHPCFSCEYYWLAWTNNKHLTKRCITEENRVTTLQGVY